MTCSTNHARINTGILAAAEKRALIWLAHRLPRSINSDHLTLLALISMAGAGAADVMTETQFTAPALAALLEQRLGDPEGLSQRAAAARALGRPDAADALAALAERLAGQQNPVT